MDKKLELELVKKYPNLFRDYGGDMKKTCMVWGFCHGNGWYNIIDNIGSRLSELNLEDKVIAIQVKEKFGGLRFYYGVDTTDIDNSEYKKIEKIITEAEKESYKTCEVCGAKGEQRGKAWIRTLCDKCNKNS